MGWIMELKGVCVYRKKGNKCSSLNIKACIGDKCTFLKTAKEIEKAQKSSFRRLAALNKERQQYIVDKYYGGKIPWGRGGKNK